MKRFLFAAGLGAAVGYLLGSEAGRAKLDRLTSRAREVASDPGVQQKVSNIAGQVRTTAGKLPDPVAGVVKNAAGQVQTKLDHSADSPLSGSSAGLGEPPSPTTSTLSEPFGTESSTGLGEPPGQP